MNVKSVTAWGTILQKKAEVGWWIIGFPLVYPGSSFHWVDFGTKRTILSRLEICCAPLSAEIHEWPMQREVLQDKVFLRGKHMGKAQETAAWGIKGQLGAVGTSPSSSDCAWNCLTPVLPPPALASSTGCCARKHPGLSICDKSNIMVMILKTSSLKLMNSWEILL